jgi:23S rRNA (guanine1835-N2)-methyltransferase
MPPEIELNLAGISLRLCRYPLDADEKLRAWDAADEYVLSYISENPFAQQAKKILIFNDGFGALSLGLRCLPNFKDTEITVVSDSAISHSAIELNAAKNKIELMGTRIINSFEICQFGTEPPYDLVVIKIPKSLAQLEDNLRRIAAKLSKDTQVIGAGMVKNVHSSTLALFEKNIGTTKSSLAKKKARLIFSSPMSDRLKLLPEPAKQFRVSKEIGNTPEDLALASYPGVFCHGSLDYGTQFMLESLQLLDYRPDAESLDILDLGCGTGALGFVAAMRLQELRNLPLTVTFADESYAATESVKKSIEALLPPLPSTRFQTFAINGLDGIADESQDLILNNPPFHDAAARTSAIALEMFRESKRVLRIGGQLQVVANRHLGYHKPLKALFGNCKTMASNEKFVVLSCIKKPG